MKLTKLKEFKLNSSENNSRENRKAWNLSCMVLSFLFFIIIIVLAAIFFNVGRYILSLMIA